MNKVIKVIIPLFILATIFTFNGINVNAEANTNKDLTVTTPTTLPSYFVGDTVTAEQLFEDSGATIVGGTAPYTFGGEDVDTTVTGIYKETITITDNSTPPQVYQEDFEYLVTTPMVASSQINIPEYSVGQVVSPSKLLSDAGINVSGGLGGYSYSGSVPTISEGSFQTGITITDSAVVPQSITIYVQFNVINV